MSKNDPKFRVKLGVKITPKKGLSVPKIVYVYMYMYVFTNKL